MFGVVLVHTAMENGDLWYIFSLVVVIGVTAQVTLLLKEVVGQYEDNS